MKTLMLKHGCWGDREPSGGRHMRCIGNVVSTSQRPVLVLGCKRCISYRPRCHKRGCQGTPCNTTSRRATSSQQTECKAAPVRRPLLEKTRNNSTQGSPSNPDGEKATETRAAAAYMPKTRKNTRKRILAEIVPISAIIRECTKKTPNTGLGWVVSQTAAHQTPQPQNGKPTQMKNKLA